MLRHSLTLNVRWMLDAVCVPSASSTWQLWLPARAPFRELRRSLELADAHLNAIVLCKDDGWQRLKHSVGNEEMSAEILNEMLARALCGWRLGRDQQDWRLTMSSEALPSGELAALIGLARLIEAGGWKRLKRCASGGCQRVFPDITNGCSNVACGAHRRQKGSADLGK